MPAQTARAPTPQPPVLLQENVGSIRLLILNRPAARNAIDAGLRTALRAAVTEAGADPDVRALLIAAPSFSLRGGTREIIRGIIARGLGLR